MKSVIKNHLYYYWYVYIVIIVICAFLTSWITNNIIRTRPYEKVQLFVGAVKVDKVKMIDKIMSIEDEQLRESNILSCPLEDSYFMTYLTSAGVTETDFIIIPEKFATTDFISSHCLSLKPYEDKLSNIYNFRYQSFKIDNYDFDMGIVIYDRASSYSLLDKYITYNINDSKYDKYYLFINKDSVNIKDIRATSDKDSNLAIEALKVLMNEE